MARQLLSRPVATALLATALFGTGMPFAKQPAGQTPPFLLTGSLYLGSGMGFNLIHIGRERSVGLRSMPASERVWRSALHCRRRNRRHRRC